MIAKESAYEKELYKENQINLIRAANKRHENIFLTPGINVREIDQSII